MDSAADRHPAPQGRRPEGGVEEGGLEQGGLEEWPYLDPAVLVRARSRKVCMTCHWFRHHAGVGCIPLLTCRLHQGLIAHGDHLTSRCRGWTDDLARQRGWAPEVG
ncbi:MAG: hypothetical protein RLZZ124_1790 [Cyanobacteriota bacterium]